MRAPGIRFGTDGWRGVIGRGFTLDNVELVAAAAARFVLEDRGSLPNRRVLVSCDRRFMSQEAAAAAAAVLAASGVETSLCAAPFPSSAVSLMTERRYGLGLQVTASHNPYYYNGVKFKWRGGSAPAAVAWAIEARLGTAPRRRRGAAPRRADHDGEYLEYLKARVPRRRPAAPVLLDFMHGCGAGYLERLLPRGSVKTLRPGRDVLFGLGAPEPVERSLAGLASAVRASGAACGFAFDGDGDRFAVFDENGRWLNPSVVFGLICDYLVNSRGVKGAVVQSVSMGRLPAAVAAAAGLPAEETFVGFKTLAERLRAGGVAAAAEESGGYAWQGNLPERDGLVTALLFLEMLGAAGRPLSRLVRRLTAAHGPSHYLRRDLPLVSAPGPGLARRLRARLPARPLGLRVLRETDLDGLKLFLEDGAWLLLRPSGTEPLLRVYAESRSPRATEGLVGLAEKAALAEGLA